MTDSEEKQKQITEEFVEMAVTTVPDQPLRGLVEDVATALGLKNLKERS